MPNAMPAAQIPINSQKFLKATPMHTAMNMPMQAKRHPVVVPVLELPDEDLEEKPFSSPSSIVSSMAIAAKKSVKPDIPLFFSYVNLYAPDMVLRAAVSEVQAGQGVDDAGGLDAEVDDGEEEVEDVAGLVVLACPVVGVVLDE